MIDAKKMKKILRSNGYAYIRCKPILHYHMYDRKFGRTKAIKATKAMKKHFEKYLKGVTL